MRNQFVGAGPVGLTAAVELAQRIVSGQTSGYHANRHAIGAKTLAVTKRVRKVIMSPSPLIRAALIATLHLPTHVPAIRRRAIRTILQT